MTQRQDVEAAAKKAGWSTDSANSGAGVDAFTRDGEGGGSLEVEYDAGGVLTSVWLEDRCVGDAQTVGLDALTLALLTGKAPRRSGEPDTNQPWDERTGHPAGSPLAVEPEVVRPARARGGRPGRAAQ